MNKARMKIFAVVACMALVAPAGAAAKGDRGKAPKAKLVSATVKGVVTGSDAGKLAVTVKRASGQAKACKGRELTFDVSKARFRTGDHNADGRKNAADVLVGHSVKVKGKVSLKKSRRTTCVVSDGQVLPAKRVENRTKPARPQAPAQGEDDSQAIEDDSEGIEDDSAGIEDDPGLDDGDELGWEDELEDEGESFEDEDYLDDESELGDDDFI